MKYTLVWWPSEADDPAISQVEVTELTRRAVLQAAIDQINDAEGYGDAERLRIDEPHRVIMLIEGWVENFWMTI